jgi:signal transduction histidine kinase
MDLMLAQRLGTTHWKSLLRHGVTTAGYCVLIALALTLADDSTFAAHLIYSLAIGLIAWLVIDGGRVLFHREASVWPHGRRDFVVMALGLSCGFLGGNMIGDALTGKPALDFLDLASGRLAPALALAFAASSSICYFYYSRGRARFLQSAISVAQRDALDAKLKLIETQLAPHMLFNTLANLRVLIAADSQRAITMLDQLDRYLRATLAGSRALSHPLENELARLEDYLELMSVRMGKRLRYALDLPDSLRELPVPPLLLQPLVENAISHGLEPLVAGGKIRVSARREHSSIVIEVFDTGAGLDAAARAHGSGFGLAHVRARLASLYGPSATLALTDAAEGGTLACLRLPLPATARSLDVCQQP